MIKMNKKTNNWLMLWSITKGFIPNLVLTILLIVFIIKFNIDTISKMMILCTGYIIVSVLVDRTIKKYWQLKLSDIKKYIMLWITVNITTIIITLVAKQLGKYGLIGLIILVVLLCLFYIFGSKNRFLNYLNALKTIEVMIFGKNLDKDNWKHKPKLKIIWGKK